MCSMGLEMYYFFPFIFLEMFSQLIMLILKNIYIIFNNIFSKYIKLHYIPKLCRLDVG